MAKQSTSSPRSDSKLVSYSGVDIYRQELKVLGGVDFSLDPGEFVYLLGKVGSGKSSLLKSIYAEIPVADGEARVYEYDLTIQQEGMRVGSRGRRGTSRERANLSVHPDSGGSLSRLRSCAA